jgi:NADPH-dependent F420 reductase
MLLRNIYLDSEHSFNYPNRSIRGGLVISAKELALRLAHDTSHKVAIGSRGAEKADKKVSEYNIVLNEWRVEANINGYRNNAAAKDAEVVVLAVYLWYVGDAIDAVADDLAKNATLITPTVGVQSDEAGFRYTPLGEGSVAQLVAAKADRSVVGAFHNLPAGRLSDLDLDFRLETLVVGDHVSAKKTAIYLAN